MRSRSKPVCKNHLAHFWPMLPDLACLLGIDIATLIWIHTNLKGNHTRDKSKVTSLQMESITMPTKTLIYSLVCSRFNSLVCSKLMFEGHKHRCECHYPDSVCEVNDADCLQAQQAVSVHIPTKQNEQCSHTH